MIQINLLPDIKRDFIRARQMKHFFTVGSIILTLIAVTVALLLFGYVRVVQPRHLKNVQTDIDQGIADLKSREDAVKIVTTQGVLEQIPGLQDKKFINSNLFGYLNGFTPRDVSYSSVQLDLVANTLTLSGQTTTLERANVLANNLKSAKFTYSKDGASQTVQPFTSVVFTSLGKSDQTSSGKNVSFQIGFQLDPVMFSQGIENPKITTNATSQELQLPTAQPFGGESSAQ